MAKTKEQTKRDKENLVERDWRNARASVKKDRLCWPFAVTAARTKTKDELLRAEQTPAVLFVRKERGL